MIVPGGLVGMVVVGTAALLCYDAMERRRAVRMAEAKVVSPELILRSNIETLRRARLPSCGRGHPAQAQTEEHRHLESES